MANVRERSGTPTSDDFDGSDGSPIVLDTLNKIAYAMDVSNSVFPIGNGLTNINISAGSTSNNLSKVVFSNLNGVTFGLNGSTVTASVNTAGGGLTNINVSAGTTSNNLSALTFANSNGITFGINASSITAEHNGLTTAMASNAGSNFMGLNSAITQNGVSMTANSSGLSLNFPAFLTTAAQSNHSHGNPTLALTNLSGTTASASNGLTISLAAAAPGGGSAVSGSWHEINGGDQGTAALWNNATYSNRPIFVPFKMQEAITAVNSICIYVSRNSGSNAVATLFAGIYTIANATSMNLVSSTSFNISLTTSAQFSGIRGLYFSGLGALSLSPGQYVLGLMASMSATNLWGMNAVGNNSLALAGHLLPGTNSTAATASETRLMPFAGVFNATSGGLPAAVGTASISGGAGENSPKIYAILKAIA